MTSTFVLRAAPVAFVLALSAPLVAQGEWTLETLREQSQGFQEKGVVARLRQIARLVQNAEQARAPLAASIHGDHREYQLKIERYLDQLADERWLSREDAERTLVEIGARAMAQIEERSASGATLEERIRSRRVVEAIVARGRDDEQRETELLRGLVATAPYFPKDERLRKALLSALGHTDPIVVEGSIRALGVVGDSRDLETMEARVLDGTPNTGVRRAALGAIGRLPVPEALAAAERILTRPGLLRPDEVTALMRDLWRRADAAPLLERLRAAADPTAAALAGLAAEAGPGTGSTRGKLQLADRDVLEAQIASIAGDTILTPGAVEGLDAARVLLADCDAIEFDHAAVAQDGARVFLTQGTLLAGELEAVDAEGVTIKSRTFGSVRVPRTAVQGLALDPALDRLVGATAAHDRLRLRDNSMVDGEIVGLEDGAMVVKADPTAEPRRIPVGEVAGLLFRRPTVATSDDTIYARIDLVDGERLLAHLGLARADVIGVAVPGIGAALVPMARVARIEFGVGGGALWGFTLIADYSDNRVIELDDQGRVVFTLEDVYGAWDAECLDNGNLLVTEFALNRVVEITRSGEVVWSFEDLKNPYDADRLPNGNTLIADTFGERVIEVTPGHEIVWKFEGVKPYDADRLANGNTLIADGRGDRVIEVSPAGDIVWELPKLDSVHDADRLPNGNTLITQRTAHRVIEVDREGNIVFSIENLNSPSDADRLPNGNTLVAENGGVREFDRRGQLVAEFPASWAVEVNRY